MLALLLLLGAVCSAEDGNFQHQNENLNQPTYMNNPNTNDNTLTNEQYAQVATDRHEHPVVVAQGPWQPVQQPYPQQHYQQQHYQQQPYPQQYQQQQYQQQAAPAGAEGVAIAHGPWVAVGDNYGRNTVAPSSGFGSSLGFNFEGQNLVTWGLGAIIILLLISTAVQVVQKLLPGFRHLIDTMSEAETGRSLDTVNTLAKFALEAIEKYEQLKVTEEK